MNIVAAAVVQDGLLAMRGEVVEYQMNSLLVAISSTQKPQELQRLLMPLAVVNITEQLLFVHIVKRQPVLNTVRPMISGGQTSRMVYMAVGLAWLRTYLQRAKLVERYCRAIGCGPVYIPAD